MSRVCIRGLGIKGRFLGEGEGLNEPLIFLDCWLLASHSAMFSITP